MAFKPTLAQVVDGLLDMQLAGLLTLDRILVGDYPDGEKLMHVDAHIRVPLPAKQIKVDFQLVNPYVLE